MMAAMGIPKQGIAGENAFQTKTLWQTYQALAGVIIGAEVKFGNKACIDGNSSDLEDHGGGFKSSQAEAP